MKLVVDTNVFIAALLKESVTRRILLHPSFEFFAPEFAFEEIEAHSVELVAKSGLSRYRLLKVIDTIRDHVTVVPFTTFHSTYRRAMDMMREIDLSDAPFLALALSFENDGVWTNDSHFHQQNAVRVWSTGDLVVELRSLEESMHF